MKKLYGVDFGYGTDDSVITTLKRPGRLLKLLRRLKIVRSKWEYKVIAISRVGK